ncbi:MAG: hypothetical protein REH79_02390 [Spiroplasma sp.]|nr:hypothetical protein [Spiroplasma sp.]
MPPKEYAIVLRDRPINSFVWLGVNKKDPKIIQGHLVLNFNNEDFYFYPRAIKEAINENFKRNKKNYQHLNFDYQKKVLDEYTKIYDKNNLFQNALFFKLNIESLVNLIWDIQKKVKGWENKSVELDVELENLKKSNNYGNYLKSQISWNRKKNNLFNEAKQFKTNIDFKNFEIGNLLTDIEKCYFDIENAVEGTFPYIKHKLLEVKVKDLEKAVTAFSDDFVKLRDQVNNFANDLENGNRALLETYDLIKDLEGLEDSGGLGGLGEPNQEVNLQLQQNDEIFTENERLTLALSNANNVLNEKNAEITRLQEEAKNYAQYSIKKIEVLEKTNQELTLQLQKTIEILVENERLTLALANANNIISERNIEITKLQNEEGKNLKVLEDIGLSDDVLADLVYDFDDPFSSLFNSTNGKSDDIINLQNYDFFDSEKGKSKRLVSDLENSIEDNNFKKQKTAVNDVSTDIPVSPLDLTRKSVIVFSSAKQQLPFKVKPKVVDDSWSALDLTKKSVNNSPIDSQQVVFESEDLDVVDILGLNDYLAPLSSISSTSSHNSPIHLSDIISNDDPLVTDLDDIEMNF